MDDQNQEKGWKQKLFDFFEAFGVYLDIFIAGVLLGWLLSFASFPRFFELFLETWGL